MNTLHIVLNRGVKLLTHGMDGKPTSSPVYQCTRKERALLKKELRKGRIEWYDRTRAQALVEFGYSFA